jgi:hypothetical protein
VNVDHRPSLANFAVALAAGTAMFTYAGGLANPAAAAETFYLALWSTLVLVALAGLARPPGLDLAGTAVLVTMVVWVVPHGPTRGAAVGLLLTLAVAVIALRHLERTEGHLTWGWAIPTAMAIQYLCRADRFLAIGLEPQVLISLVALPVAIGAIFMVLGKREESLPVLVAVSTVALLVPGWSVTVTLSTFALLTGILFRDRLTPRWLAVGLAIIVVLVADSWQPSLGWLLLLVILAKALPPNWLAGASAILATALLCIFLPEARDWPEVVRFMALGPILLPALVLPSESRRVNSIQAFVLAILALRTVDGPAALAAPLALGALSLRTRAVAAELQMVWSGVLLGGTVLLAGYPWLRSPALEDSLGLFGIQISWPFAIGVAGTLWLLSFLCAALENRSMASRCRSPLVGGLVLALLAFIALPSAAVKPLSGRIQVLNANQTARSIDLDPAVSTQTVILDSYLENSASLPAGTPVGRIILIDTEGERRSWLLRAGMDTGEWAARRPDVAGLPDFQAPTPWLSWVTASRDVFAQRYRADWQLGGASEIRRLEIELARDLPAEVSLAIFHLELRR